MVNTSSQVHHFYAIYLFDYQSSQAVADEQYWFALVDVSLDGARNAHHYLT